LAAERFAGLHPPPRAEGWLFPVSALRMTCLLSVISRAIVFALTLGVVAARVFAAGNAIAWNSVGFPKTGTTGETITFTVAVSNTGQQVWGIDYYLELRDEEGVRSSYVGLATTAPRATRTVRFSVTLPDEPGTYTYELAAMQHGGETFGTWSHTIVVHDAPIHVSVALDQSLIAVGYPAMVRSVAGPRGEVGVHGIEGRVPGGLWHVWAEWHGPGGNEQVAYPQPDSAGIYELRAFAAADPADEVVYTQSLLLSVTALWPVINRHPSSVIANVGETITLSVEAAGPELTYRWQKDGADLPGATGATLALAPARISQSGSYTVIVANAAGNVISRSASVTIAALSLPPLTVEVWNFPASGGKRSVSLSSAQVGDVISLSSAAAVAAQAGWRHHLLVRRPAITAATASLPEDGSGLTNAHEVWNVDGWGNPHTSSYDARVTGAAAADLGNRAPFVHTFSGGETTSTRSVDFVLDAPGAWYVQAEIVDAAGERIAASTITGVTVAAPTLVTDMANISYPYGRDDRFAGVFWNAGQAHRLWSTWRADFQVAYRDTWAVNWQLMWQPSPYFRRTDGGWLKPEPVADSPWQAFWSAHQVYAVVPDGAGAGKLTHDLTSRTFAEKAAVRLMDIGIDFVAVDYTNQFLEEREAVLPAVDNLAQAFQAVAPQSQSGQRIKLAAVVPANVNSGDWGASGGFGPLGIARFNAKLTTLYNRYARYEAAWFYLEDDQGVRKPLILLWIGAGGEGEPDGTLAPAKLSQLRLTDGRLLTDVFTVRWVGAYLSNNPRFLTGDSYTAATASGAVTGKYANPKLWSYHEHFPAAATLMSGRAGSVPAVEAVTVQPLAVGRDRFDRAWEVNWPAGQGYHYETPATNGAIPLANYGKTWRDGLAAARALQPKFLLTTWAEFGSENDEPRPEMSVTIMDNNKFGTHFGDALKQTVRLFKYREPTAWIDTFTVAGTTRWLNEAISSSLPALHRDQSVRLQGWVAPNVATTFAGGSVKVVIDDRIVGEAIVGGAWNGATKWYFDLEVGNVSAGNHNVKVVASDGVGGSALAGVQLRGEPLRNSLPLYVEP
jgi:hypothetical protein